MTKTLSSLFICLILPLAIKAQNAREGVVSPPGFANEVQSPRTVNLKKSSAVTTIWSEDFSAGIPSTWTNQGYDVNPSSGVRTPNPLCNWEYRGPTTTPNRNTGSRGAWAAGTGPVASPTRTNGFIIFDSDYLDNSGSQTNPGSGVSPAPHIGTLTTDTIDLTGFTDVEIAMYSHCRQYSSRFFVAVSNDGGQSFTDTIEFHQDVPLNSTSGNPVALSANISAVAGNQPYVVLSFIYDGTPAVNTSSGSAWGYYYWQIDDIEIRELPEYSVKFVEWRNAPPHDIVYPQGYAKYGHLNLEQAVPINFDSNIFNYGSEDLTNVKLKVEIRDATNGNLVNTFTSPAKASLASQDSLGYTDLTSSTAWTPTTTGTFNIIYSIESDSIPAAAGSYTPMDTFTIRINDENISNGRYSFDWRRADNYVGTDNLATGSMIALGERFNFPAPSKDTSGFVFIDGMTMIFDNATDGTATIIWEVYDTAGFSYGTGGPVGNPFFQKSFQLTPSAPGGAFLFDFTDELANGDIMPLALPSGGAYYFIMNMIPNATNGVVRVANDQTFDNPTFSVVAQADDGSWFGGFNNSDNLSGPIFRLQLASKPPYNIGLEAFEARNSISVYPNPTTGERVEIEFDNGGTYQIEIIDLQGKLVSSEEVTVYQNEKITRNYTQLSSGVYMLNIYNEKYIARQKLQVK